MATLVSHPDEVRVVSKRFGQGATNIDRYLELDGYKAVRKALGMQPDAIINEVKNSGLRGRGGAGFNTGLSGPSFLRPRRSRNIFCATVTRANPAPAKTGSSLNMIRIR